MSISVDSTFRTPLSEEDDQILAGTAFWLMATANRTGQQAQPQDGTPGDDDEATPRVTLDDAGDQDPAPRPSLSDEESERGEREAEELDREGRSGITLTVPSPRPR